MVGIGVYQWALQSRAVPRPYSRPAGCILVVKIELSSNIIHPRTEENPSVWSWCSRFKWDLDYEQYIIQNRCLSHFNVTAKYPWPPAARPLYKNKKKNRNKPIHYNCLKSQLLVGAHPLTLFPAGKQHLLSSVASLMFYKSARKIKRSFRWCRTLMDGPILLAT